MSFIVQSRGDEENSSTPGWRCGVLTVQHHFAEQYYRVWGGSDLQNIRGPLFPVGIVSNIQFAHRKVGDIRGLQPREQLLCDGDLLDYIVVFFS